MASTIMWLAIVLMVLINVIFQASNSSLVKLSNINRIPAQILAQFQDYDLVVHFDNATAKNLSAIFPLLDHCQAVYLVNYDVENRRHRRPPGYRYINIVYLKDPFTFESYSEVDYNFMQYDFVVIITESDIGRFFGRHHVRFTEIWQMSGLKHAASVIIFTMTTDRIYHCCYYCGNRSGVLRSVPPSGPTLTNLRQLINNYTDFHGHVFKIAYANFPPFFWCQYQNQNFCEPHGAEGQILKEFSKLYNFRYKLVQHKSELNEHGEWQAMVEGVHFRRVDWAVGGISVTVERGISTDFTRYIKTQGFSILYATYDQTWLAVESILLVFKWSVWVGIATAIFFIGLSTRFSINYHNSSDSKKIIDYMQIAVMSIVEQSTSIRYLRSLNFTSVRVIFLTWWLMSMCLTTIYKSQLASSLIRPNYKEPKNIEEMVDRGFDFKANKEDWSVLKENLIFSSDQVFGKVLQRIDNDLEFCQAVISTINGKIAVIDEESPIQYDVFKKCTPNLTVEDRAKLRLVTQNIFPNAYHAWCMQMSTPFRLKFSKTIGRMDDAGLIHHWYQAAFSYHLPRSNERSRHHQYTVSLKITQILPPLFILATGLSLAFFILLWEIFIFDNCRQIM